MLIALGIFLIVSVFEVRYLLIQREKKEAALYLGLTALALGLSVYLMLTPNYYSFARMINELFKAQ